MRIAVLFHAGERHFDLSSYIVDHLARHWREDGHDVLYLFGTQRFEPADLLLVHVNLSVVPGDYLRFASRYPIVLNARVQDIRKSVISRNLVVPGDAWQGAVIVKSNLNYGGQPEDALGRNWIEQHFPLWRRVMRRAARAFGRHEFEAHWRNYQIFSGPREVPKALMHSRDIVVEKFRPERDGDLYHLRIYQFLGDRSLCTRLASPSRIIKAQNSVNVEPIEPHPDIVACRAALAMDYGKLDYVVNRGEMVLLDVNKTVGASRQMADADLAANRRYLAEGLYSYFARTRVPESGAARRDGDAANR